MKPRIKIYKILVLIFIIFPFTNVAKTQGINNNLRSLDDNHSLASDTTDWRFFRSIKEMELSGESPIPNISIGGEIREQLRMYNNLNYGDANPSRDVFLQQRYMIHTDIFINKHIRLFTQLHATNVEWKNSISLSDKENLDFSQAFLDISINPLSSRFRFGRQELCYGAERILGTRDGPNNRQTFDGLRYTLNIEKLTGDFFIVSPVAFQPGMFDNTRSKNYLILAGYWTLLLKNKDVLELYYFGTNRDYITEDEGSSTEKRHSFGARFSKTSGSFYYDAEGTLQRGSFQNQYINGWQFTSIVGYRWKNLQMSPKIQIKGSIFNGNKSSTDDEINSFRPISSKPTVNDMLPIGPTNIIMLNPEGEIGIFNDVALTIKYYAIWRLRRTDGLYSTDMEKMIRPPDEPGENNGYYAAGGPTAEIYYIAGKHFNISLQTGYFIPGIYIKNTGAGKNLQAFSLKAYYRF